MKFTASGIVSSVQSAVNVIAAFFENFNKDSYVGIKNGNIQLEIFFEEENLPIEIVKALGSIEEIEFTYGQMSSEGSASEMESESDSMIKEEGKDEATSTEANTEEVKENTGDEETKGNEELATLESMLDKLAQNSKNFEDFINRIGEWLKLGKRKPFFDNVVNVLAENPNKKWKDIYSVLNERKISYETWEKSQLNRKISKRLGTMYTLTFLNLLQKIASYKRKFFPETAISTVQEQDSANGKANHIPQIPDFEQQLESLDENKTCMEKAKFVFDLMNIGENRNPADEYFEENMTKIVGKAIESKEADITNAIIQTNIATPDMFTLQMQISTFINNFFGNFYPNAKVCISDFLGYLMGIIT